MVSLVPPLACFLLSESCRRREASLATPTAARRIGDIVIPPIHFSVLATISLYAAWLLGFCVLPLLGNISCSLGITKLVFSLDRTKETSNAEHETGVFHPPP